MDNTKNTKNTKSSKNSKTINKRLRTIGKFLIGFIIVRFWETPSVWVLKNLPIAIKRVTLVVKKTPDALKQSPMLLRRQAPIVIKNVPSMLRKQVVFLKTYGPAAISTTAIFAKKGAVQLCVFSKVGFVTAAKVTFFGLPVFTILGCRRLSIVICRGLVSTSVKVKSGILAGADHAMYGCIYTIFYVSTPVTIGSTHMRVANPYLMLKGSFVLLKSYLWDPHILADWAAVQSGSPYTIGYRPIFVIVYCTLWVYFNWHWNLFGEIEAGYLPLQYTMPKKYYYMRFRKVRHRKLGEKYIPHIDKPVPGAMGEKFRWEYLKSLRLFIWWLGTWY